MDAIENKPDTTKVTKEKNDLTVLGCISNVRFTVYLVHSKYLNKHCIMKIFPLNSSDNKLFYQNEARISKLSHPNIIQIYETEPKKKTVFKGKTIDVAYTVMELATYGDFTKLLQNPRFVEDEILVRSYFWQLIHAVDHMHSKGFAHLDLKPENLLLSHDFKLKIADFDSTYHVEDKNKIITRGTKNFRAPEMISGSPRNITAADIYSLGILLFAMKTGAMPYIEENMNEGIAVLQNDPESFWNNHSKFLGDVSFSDDFKELFEKMTKADPEERCTLEEIKQDKWMNYPVYDEDRMIHILKEFNLPEVKIR